MEDSSLAAVSHRDKYLFDLQGFLIIRNALSPEELGSINDWIDAMPETKPGDWIGAIHRQDHEEKFGINLQQIYEAEPFTHLIDHPRWAARINQFIGAEDSFDAVHGPYFIDENFLNIRGPGQSISLHSGGHEGVQRTRFNVVNEKFHCGQVNILMAFRDIGPGDGATMVIPGSHKSNFEHHQLSSSIYGETPVDGIEEAIEVHLQAGDAVLFVDALSHGSAERKNPGERRIAVFRYGPSWGRSRHGYSPSKKLIERLTPIQRQIINPGLHLNSGDQ